MTDICGIPWGCRQYRQLVTIKSEKEALRSGFRIVIQDAA